VVKLDHMKDYSAQESLNITKELEPFLENEINKHLAITKMWYPHEYIPWSDGQNYDGPMNGLKWDPSQSKISTVVKDSLLLSLLGEDNLPAYHTELSFALDKDGPWRTWIDIWSAEESRHATALRDYIITTRVMDPKELEDMRLNHMKNRLTLASYKQDTVHVIVYTTIQELATRVIHVNTAKITNESIGESLMARIAMDENLHFITYRNLVENSFEIEKNITMQAVCEVICHFDFPQRNVPGYKGIHGSKDFQDIYSYRIHLDQVIYPILKYWDVKNLDLSAVGNQYRDKLYAYIYNLEKRAKSSQ
jgi:acyl-[acyl-carrier-protein] desaturase